MALLELGNYETYVSFYYTAHVRRDPHRHLILPYPTPHSWFLSFMYVSDFSLDSGMMQLGDVSHNW